MTVDLSTKEKYFILDTTPYRFYSNSDTHKSTINSWVDELFGTGGHNSIVYSDISHYAKKLRDGDMRGVCCLYYEGDSVVLYLLLSYKKRREGKDITEGQLNNLYSNAKQIGKKLDTNKSRLNTFIQNSKQSQDKKVFTN
jgi:hypothetical protein